MRLGRIILLLALVLVVGLGAFWLFGMQGGGGGPEEAAPPVVETIPVVYLVQPVSRGETIPAEKLDNFYKKHITFKHLHCF